MSDDGIPTSSSESPFVAGNVASDDHSKSNESDLASQTGQECKDQGTDQRILNSQSGNAEAPLTSDIPPPKRYAHHGKRRRKFTEELFRCQHVDKISRSDLVCNALLWKNRPQELRAHLQEHIDLDQIGKMSDDEVREWYVQAKRIFLQGIPEDLDESEDEDDEQED